VRADSQANNPQELPQKEITALTMLAMDIVRVSALLQALDGDSSVISPGQNNHKLARRKAPKEKLGIQVWNLSLTSRVEIGEKPRHPRSLFEPLLVRDVRVDAGVGENAGED
jgi:hypothetical protein